MAQRLLVITRPPQAYERGGFREGEIHDTGWRGHARGPDGRTRIAIHSPGRRDMRARGMKTVVAAIAIALTTGATSAADWSDTAASIRYGKSFAEPYDNNADGSRKDIKKDIFALTHVSGYKYGTNFFNVDVLISDSSDPGGGTPGKPGAQEVYLVYRHTLDLGKMSGSDFKFGPVRGLGLTAGIDLNTKNDF